ncbi:hypothetical protein [Gilvimarinus chinensis]|uniref:hypothetical protein n=1 Tax=Gilvimarinus chinensis TaxID=396005 RepID=UPI0012F75F2B|nr:hypothetical protein [Gilvimarinus chinensis]
MILWSILMPLQCVLFFCFLVALTFGLWGLSVFVAYMAEIKALELVSGFGSLLSGVSAAVMAFLAYVGVNAWKRQLKSSKYLNLIWEASAALRGVKAHKIDWYWSNVFEGYDDLSDFKGKLDVAFNEFESSCNSLDAIVTKNHWHWANLCGDLKTLCSLIEEKMDSKSLDVGCIKHNQELAKLNFDFDRLALDIERKLSFLEDEYL